MSFSKPLWSLASRLMSSTVREHDLMSHNIRLSHSQLSIYQVFRSICAFTNISSLCCSLLCKFSIRASLFLQHFSQSWPSARKRTQFASDIPVAFVRGIQYSFVSRSIRTADLAPLGLYIALIFAAFVHIIKTLP